jgi:subtilisin family serine protease
LDEGVDTSHPYLASGIVAEADFIDQTRSAMPTGDDAHGTACAGIIGSRDDEVRGVAPGVSMVAVKIARSSGKTTWIIDDFQVSDAIDWAWDEGAADVLSNSWGGGPQVDVISASISRAQNSGRNGQGSVVVFSAGNSQKSVEFPATLPNVLGVGASNQWDERKTRTSRDGENWWGSNFGKGLDLVAPGVQILTTDISGSRGYTSDLTVPWFNGTSAATPFVSAAAAMILSVCPNLEEETVRQLLLSTTDHIGSRTRGKWEKYVGFGRVNVFNALRAARKR